MTRPFFTTEEFNHYFSYCQAPLWTLQLCRLCLLNPDADNTRLLYSRDEPEFRNFLKTTFSSLVKIHFRQSGFGIFLPNHELNRHTQAFVNAFLSDIERDHKRDMRLPDPVVNRAVVQLEGRPFPTVINLIKAIHAFVSEMHNREQPQHLMPIANAWLKFLAADTPFAKECKAAGYGILTERYATHGLFDNGFLWDGKQIVWDHVNLILGGQRRIAEHNSIKNHHELRLEVIKILKAYAGIMRPEYLLFRQQAKEVVQRKREHFAEVRKRYLAAVANLSSREKLSPLARINPATLVHMRQHNSFGQRQNEDSIYALSIEHVVPLLSGDNFEQNFAVESQIINYDMNRLVWLQTAALEMDRDRYAVRDGYPIIEQFGRSWSIIVMRPLGKLSNGWASPLVLGEEETPLGTDRKGTVGSVTKQIITAPFRRPHERSIIVEQKHIPR